MYSDVTSCPFYRTTRVCLRYFDQTIRDDRTSLGKDSLIMLVRQMVNIFLSIFFYFLVLPKQSKQSQTKPEDCIKGLQYWSITVLPGVGSCASCPRHWTTCDDQPEVDKQPCEESCRGKL